SAEYASGRRFVACEIPIHLGSTVLRQRVPLRDGPMDIGGGHRLGCYGAFADGRAATPYLDTPDPRRVNVTSREEFVLPRLISPAVPGARLLARRRASIVRRRA